MIDFFSTTEAFADPGPFAPVAQLGLVLALIGLLLAVVLPVIFVRLEDRQLAAEGSRVDHPADGETLEGPDLPRLKRQWRIVVASIVLSVAGSIVLVGATGVVSLQQRNDEIHYYADQGRDVYGVTLGFGDLAALGIIDRRSHREIQSFGAESGFLKPNPVELRRVESGERIFAQAKKIDERSFSLYEIAPDGTAAELQPLGNMEQPSGVG